MGFFFTRLRDRMRRIFGDFPNWLVRTGTRIGSISQACGGDGFAMLALSNLAIVASAGLIWLVLLRRVHGIAQRTPCRPAPAAYVLVLGMRLKRGAVARDYAERLDRAAELMAADPACKALLLGGTTDAGPHSEALAGQRYLARRGIAAERLLLEDRSRHTLENLREARQLLAAGNFDAPLLVTSRYHLARSAAIAHGLGLPHRLCAAEPELNLDASTVLRLLKESYHLHWYYTGKAWARLTRNRKMLARIS